MTPRGVLVSCSDTNCSGLLFAGNWVLVHGALLASADLDGLESVPSRPCPPSHAVSDISVFLESPEGASRRSATLVAMWRCPLVERMLDTVLSEWRFVSDEDKYNDPGANRRLLPLFLLLRLGDEDVDATGALRRLASHVTTTTRGHKLTIESTPFGKLSFLNSWSSGVLSTTAGPHQCLLLCDAQTTPGCEGAPIFLQGSRNVVGLVAAPLCWWRGEWIGLTLGLALHPVLARFIHVDSPQTPIADIPENADDAVVLVRCGPTWGTGVLVDAERGTLLTCAHVVKLHPKLSVSVFCKGKTFPATVVFRTVQNELYDIAVLQIGLRWGLAAVQIADTPPAKGEVVLAMGFPLISEQLNPALQPAVSRGIVSHVGSSHLRTTCCVQSGLSGGAILRSTGELLGVIVCNLHAPDSGAIYPHVNLAIPAFVLRSPLQQFRKTKDPRELECLMTSDPVALKEWTLQPPPLSRL